MIDANALKTLTVLLESLGYYVYLENNALLGRFYEATKELQNNNYYILRIDLEKNYITLISKIENNTEKLELSMTALATISHINEIIDVLSLH